MSQPAARIGDMHICPMVSGTVPHVGGPVLPPCAPTVLTGSLPQARIGDLCTCVGPPDAISTGAFTVLVSGRPAARLGDSTVHGGKVVAGLFTVLIGDKGGASSVVSSNSFWAVGQGSTGALSQMKPECAEIAKAIDDAMLADHTYGRDPTLPDGYRKLDSNTPLGQAELARLGVGSADLAPDGSTFRAEVFARSTPGGDAYTVAFRGTAESADWIENGRQGFGMQSDHYDRAMRIANRVSQNAEQVSFTGHSLGGGLASAAAVRTGRPANTFNAAGLSARTARGYPEVSAPVKAYYVPGEVLSTAQDQRKGILLGIGAIASAIHPSLGALTMGWIAAREVGDSPLLPPAYGAKNALPVVAPSGKSIYESWIPTKVIADSVDRHGMDWVSGGLKKQRADMGCH